MTKHYNEKNFTLAMADGTIETVYCYTTYTRQGFCHTARCFGYTDTKCSYLNRTWEQYDYESVLKKWADKLPKDDCDIVLKQLDKIAEKGSFDAEQWFKNVKSIYDGLHDNTKEHLAKALDGKVLTTTEDVENVLKISKAFDVLLNM